MATRTELSLTDRLLRYSATASLVTSASLMWVSGSASANGTPHIVFVGETLGPNETWYLDIDSNGTDDLMFHISTFPDFYFDYGASPQGPPRSNMFVRRLPYTLDTAFIGQRSSAYALEQSVWVNTTPYSGNWIQPTIPPVAHLTDYSGEVGNWLDLSGSRFLGVRINGDDHLPHYAWVELMVDDASPYPPQLTILQYAYNPTPNEGILTGTGPVVVDLTTAKAAGGLHALTAGLLAALGGALHWLRHKLKQS